MPSNLRGHDEPGHVHFWTISCYRRLGFFHYDAMKQVVIDGLRLLQKKYGICLIGYVVMPDHVHLLLYPHPGGKEEPIAISGLLSAFKQNVGYYGKDRLREYWRRNGALWSEPLNTWASNATDDRPIWTPRGYDFNIDRMETLIEKLDYCHKNPITRGLVESADQWPWSSLRFYELGDRCVLTIDWDGTWPVQW